MLENCEEVTGFCPSIVRQLLGSRKTTVVVLNFLKTTYVCLRPRKQEQRQKGHGRRRAEAGGLEKNRL